MAAADVVDAFAVVRIHEHYASRYVCKRAHCNDQNMGSGVGVRGRGDVGRTSRLAVDIWQLVTHGQSAFSLPSGRQRQIGILRPIVDGGRVCWTLLHIPYLATSFGISAGYGLGFFGENVGALRAASSIK